MKRIPVGFNTLNSEPVDFVKLAFPGSWQEEALPPLVQGEWRGAVLTAWARS